MKQSTVKKYINILKEAKESNKKLSQFCKDKCLNYSNITSTIHNLKKQSNSESEDVNQLMNLYNSLINKKNQENRTEIEYLRDDEGKITSYKVKVYKRDKAPFITTLSRDDSEKIFGYYTYYGSNITARNVANEFPEYTLSDIKGIFRAFELTKDSIWAPPHLVEEYTPEQLSNYRMQLKERAAFKYADYRQERDFKNIINKLASKINKLEDGHNFIKELIDSKVEFDKTPVYSYSTDSTQTGIVCLSDLHVGAANQKEGYLELTEYNENEINRRLEIISQFINSKQWNNIIILNLGDNVDSYRKMTTSMTHELPCNYTDREIANMYLKVMMQFFNGIAYKDKVQYISIGTGNHSGAFGYLLEVALSYQLKAEFNISGYVSKNEIDSFDVNDISFVYLHGRSEAIKGQKKPFPLNLDVKTQCWFNDFFSDTTLNLKKRKVVLKGDLHQYSINSVSSFDYINCPSIYGSSSYIISNYGNTPWGCAYLEVNNNNYTSGIIKE